MFNSTRGASQRCGPLRVIFFMNTQRLTAKRYDSPPTSLDDQLNILRQRGLEISNSEQAKSFLSQVSYYRFSGYALYYEIFTNDNRTHQYKHGSTFDKVVYLYEFDSELRTLLFKTTEFIEIAFRTQLCLHTSLETEDSHWHLDKSLFKEEFKCLRENKRSGKTESQHQQFLGACENELDRSKELFIQNYKDNYTTPKTPASWMMIEVLSLGMWSRIYHGLNSSGAKTAVASYFKLKPKFLAPWIRSVSVLRNSCAHHARLWNRPLSVPPKLNKDMQEYYSKRGKTNRLVLALDIISELLKPLGKYEWFIDQLNQLFKQYPDIPYESMGLTANHFTKDQGVRG